MKYLDRTEIGAAENLACDEALLDECEAGGGDEILRLYEPAGYFVVLGYANRAGREARLEACRSDGIPVLRRCSGGGAVLQGPGCLNYSVVLRTDRPETASIPAASRFIMERTRDLLQTLLPGEVRVQGHTDLTWNGRKFSGNAQRRKKRALLFHGTILHGLDLARMDRWLGLPSVAPEYRQGRGHADFVINLPLAPEAIKARLREGWAAVEARPDLPDWSGLMRERYGREEWNLKF